MIQETFPVLNVVNLLVLWQFSMVLIMVMLKNVWATYILASISNKSKDLESHLTARIAKSCLLPHKCHRSNSQPTIQHNSYILQLQQNHRRSRALFWCLNLVNIAATFPCALVAIFPLNAPLPASAPPSVFFSLCQTAPNSREVRGGWRVFP